MVFCDLQMQRVSVLPQLEVSDVPFETMINKATKISEQQEVSPLSCATRGTDRHEFGFVGKVINLAFLEAPYLDLSDSTLLGAEYRS